MNVVCLIGRVTQDIDLKQTDKGNFVVNFDLAVDKPKSDAANFISCVIWGEYAGKMSKILYKGQQIGVNGSLNTLTYEDKNGSKHYITEVIVDRIKLLDKKREENMADAASADDVLLANSGIPL